MPELVIERASLRDAAELVELGARTFRATYESTTDATELEEYVASSFTLECIETQLRAPASYFFLASEQTRLVGYVHIRVVAPPACVAGLAPIELSRLYLEPDVQGRGFGAQLMQFALDESRRLDRRTIWLGVYDENTRARDFYRRWGFEDVGTREFEFGGTIYHDPVMSRPL
jgi:ribosomal protein S18 acetylase RimI-like enzyme